MGNEAGVGDDEEVEGVVDETDCDDDDEEESEDTASVVSLTATPASGGDVGASEARTMGAISPVRADASQDTTSGWPGRLARHARHSDPGHGFRIAASAAIDALAVRIAAANTAGIAGREEDPDDPDGPDGAGRCTEGSRSADR